MDKFRIVAAAPYQPDFGLLTAADDAGRVDQLYRRIRNEIGTLTIPVEPLDVLDVEEVGAKMFLEITKKLKEYPIVLRPLEEISVKELYRKISDSWRKWKFSSSIESSDEVERDIYHSDFAVVHDILSKHGPTGIIDYFIDVYIDDFTRWFKEAFSTNATYFKENYADKYECQLVIENSWQTNSVISFNVFLK